MFGGSRSQRVRNRGEKSRGGGDAGVRRRLFRQTTDGQDGDVVVAAILPHVSHFPVGSESFCGGERGERGGGHRVVNHAETVFAQRARLGGDDGVRERRGGVRDGTRIVRDDTLRGGCFLEGVSLGDATELREPRFPRRLESRFACRLREFRARDVGAREGGVGLAEEEAAASSVATASAMAARARFATPT